MTTELAEQLTLPSNVQSFLTETVRYSTIATINPDGSPHQIVIWYLLRGDAIVVNSRRGRRWPSNLRRDGRANLAVYEAEDAVTLDLTVVDSYDDERAQADIAEMARRYDTPEAAQREIARFGTEERVSFVLKPTRVHLHGSPG